MACHHQTLRTPAQSVHPNPSLKEATTSSPGSQGVAPSEVRKVPRTWMNATGGHLERVSAHRMRRLGTPRASRGHVAHGETTSEEKHMFGQRRAHQLPPRTNPIVPITAKLPRQRLQEGNDAEHRRRPPLLGFSPGRLWARKRWSRLGQRLHEELRHPRASSSSRPAEADQGFLPVWIPTTSSHRNPDEGRLARQRDRCARCLSVIRCRCHVICLRVASCHVIICIASSCFQNLHPSEFSSFRPLSVLSPDTLARARGMSEILFYKWPENVLGLG